MWLEESAECLLCGVGGGGGHWGHEWYVTRGNGNYCYGGSGGNEDDGGGDDDSPSGDAGADRHMLYNSPCSWHHCPRGSRLRRYILLRFPV